MGGETILCLDDCSILLDTRSIALRNAGFSVLIADDRSRAENILESMHIDAILLRDPISEPLSEFLLEAKKSRPFLPIVLLTSCADVNFETDHDLIDVTANSRISSQALIHVLATLFNWPQQIAREVSEEIPL
jgi:response regulator RpfG family c-di-GMP phosphodiesterase